MQQISSRSAYGFRVSGGLDRDKAFVALAGMVRVPDWRTTLLASRQTFSPAR
jgi:hypothetical protein